MGPSCICRYNKIITNFICIMVLYYNIDSYMNEFIHIVYSILYCRIMVSWVPKGLAF